MKELLEDACNFNQVDENGKQRMRYELKIIKKTGTAKLFLFAVRLIYCYACSTTMGNEGCSYVNWLLGITNVNPLLYLPFERFFHEKKECLPSFTVYIKVQKIGDNAFCKCNNITKLSFPEATEIDKYAFGECTKLSELSLPKLTKVSDNTFVNCNNLKEIYLPKVTELGTYAFVSSSIEAITFGSQITELGSGALLGLINICKKKLSQCFSPLAFSLLKFKSFIRKVKYYCNFISVMI